MIEMSLLGSLLKELQKKVQVDSCHKVLGECSEKKLLPEFFLSLVHKQNLRLNLTMFPEECIISRALACTFRTRFGAMNSILCLEHATMSTFANCMPSHACIFILLSELAEVIGLMFFR